VQRFAKALVALGLQRYDGVNITGFNSPGVFMSVVVYMMNGSVSVCQPESTACLLAEWVVANMGTIAAGGVSVGVYSTNKADTCEYVARHSNAVVRRCAVMKHDCNEE